MQNDMHGKVMDDPHTVAAYKNKALYQNWTKKKKKNKKTRNKKNYEGSEHGRETTWNKAKINTGTNTMIK